MARSRRTVTRLSSGVRDYFLRSRRLGFSLWTPADLPLATALWGDPQVMRLTGGPCTPEQVRTRLQREIDNCEHHGIQYWPVFLAETGEHIGCCGLQPREPAQGVYEVGFQLRAASWGRGFGHEAAETVVMHAFTGLGIRALFAGHHPDNRASRAVLTRLGFHYTHHEFYPPTGQLEPCYLLRRSEWPRSLARLDGPGPQASQDVPPPNRSGR